MTNARVTAEAESTRSADQDAFHPWFGNSKAVTSRNEPLVVYHGTASNIESFDQDKASVGLMGVGFYYTTSCAEAAAYAAAGGIGANVIPAHLSIQNPLIIGGKRPTVFAAQDGSLGTFIQAFRAAAQEFPTIPAGGVAYMVGDRFRQEAARSRMGGLAAEDIIALVQAQVALNDGPNLLQPSATKMRMLQRAFMVAGFDGVIDHTVAKRSKGKMPGVDNDTRHYIAFQPVQIRMALQSPEAMRANVLLRALAPTGARSVPPEAGEMGEPLAEQETGLTP